MAETTTTDMSTSATTVVDAPPEEVFDFIRQPANHPLISGDASVRTVNKGPERLALGDKFNMSMKMGMPYRMSSRVVEYEENAKIAWAHFGKHRWRWELEPTGEGQTRLTETFDMSTAISPAVLKLAGYPKRHEPNVAASVENVAAHFSKG